MTDDDDGLEALAYIKYEWDCPACGWVSETEADPAGETLECPGCNASVRISETR